MFILVQPLLSLLLFICHSSAVEFYPDTSDYDAYGLKIAANNLMIVEAQNDFTEILVQFAPYTDNVTQGDENGCVIEYDDSSQYIYAVALGKNQSIYNFFFVGEMVGLDEDDYLPNRTFIGYVNYTGSLTILDFENGFYGDTQFVPIAFPHQEHLVMVTDPLGLVAYGFSDLFTFSYTLATDTLVVHQNNSLSPSTSFLPLAVDYDGSYGVIVGFLDNGRNSRM
jgi:hypothetical protein